MTTAELLLRYEVINHKLFKLCLKANEIEGTEGKIKEVLKEIESLGLEAYQLLNTSTSDLMSMYR